MNSSLEHVRQGILTMHTLLSTMNAEQLDAENPQSGEHDQPFDSSMEADSWARSPRAASGYSERSSGGASSIEPVVPDEYAGTFTEESASESGGCRSPASPQSHSSSSSSGTKQFFLGQWLDVKDTVNQWLEATVMAVNVRSYPNIVHHYCMI